MVFFQYKILYVFQNPAQAFRLLQKRLVKDSYFDLVCLFFVIQKNKKDATPR